VIDYLSYIDSPDTAKELVIPDDFSAQVELFENAEYLGLDDLKIKIVSEAIMNRPEFIKYTNVRRHYLDNLGEESLEYVLECMTPQQLIFTLTDPALE
jgi:hypothetical protein